MDPVNPSAVLEELLCRLSLLQNLLRAIKAKGNIEIVREILPLNEGVQDSRICMDMHGYAGYGL